MAITFPVRPTRRDLSELSPVQLEATYAEIAGLADRLGPLLELAELIPFAAALGQAQRAVYARLLPAPAGRRVWVALCSGRTGEAFCRARLTLGWQRLEDEVWRAVLAGAGWVAVEGEWDGLDYWCPEHRDQAVAS